MYASYLPLMSRGSFVLCFAPFLELFRRARRVANFLWGRRTPLDPSKKALKTNGFFNIFAFWPHQAPTYMHHTCHLMSRGSFVLCFASFLVAFSTKKPHTSNSQSLEASKPRSLEVPRRESRSEINLETKSTQTRLLIAPPK